MPSRCQASTRNATEPISIPAISQAAINAIMLILSLRCGRSAPQAAMDIRPMGRSALTDQGLSEADIYITNRIKCQWILSKMWCNIFSYLCCDHKQLFIENGSRCFLITITWRSMIRTGRNVGISRTSKRRQVHKYVGVLLLGFLWPRGT